MVIFFFLHSVFCVTRLFAFYYLLEVLTESSIQEKYLQLLVQEEGGEKTVMLGKKIRWFLLYKKKVYNCLYSLKVV